MIRIKNSLLALAFMVPVLFTTSCKDDDDNGWSEADKDTLVAECVKDQSGTQEQCECLIDKMTSEFSKEQVENEDFSDADALTLLTFYADCGVSIFSN